MPNKFNMDIIYLLTWSESVFLMCLGWPQAQDLPRKAFSIGIMGMVTSLTSLSF